MVVRVLKNNISVNNFDKALKISKLSYQNLLKIKNKIKIKYLLDFYFLSKTPTPSS